MDYNGTKNWISYNIQEDLQRKDKNATIFSFSVVFVLTILLSKNSGNITIKKDNRTLILEP